MRLEEAFLVSRGSVGWGRKEGERGEGRGGKGGEGAGGGDEGAIQVPVASIRTVQSPFCLRIHVPVGATRPVRSARFWYFHAEGKATPTGTSCLMSNIFTFVERLSPFVDRVSPFAERVLPFVERLLPFAETSFFCLSSSAFRGTSFFFADRLLPFAEHPFICRASFAFRRTPCLRRTPFDLSSTVFCL